MLLLLLVGNCHSSHTSHTLPLHRFFWMIDEIAEKYPVEKIKTIGDAYLLVSGIPQRNSDHAEVVTDLALELLDSIAGFNELFNTSIRIRVGISSGVCLNVEGKREKRKLLTLCY